MQCKSKTHLIKYYSRNHLLIVTVTHRECTFYTRWVLTQCHKVDFFVSRDEVIVCRVWEDVATRSAFLAGAGKLILLLALYVGIFMYN